MARPKKKKIVNQERVLAVMPDQGLISTADVINKCGLKSVVVGNTLSDLADDGMIETLGKGWIKCLAPSFVKSVMSKPW